MEIQERLVHLLDHKNEVGGIFVVKFELFAVQEDV